MIYVYGRQIRNIEGADRELGYVGPSFIDQARESPGATGVICSPNGLPGSCGLRQWLAEYCPN